MTSATLTTASRGAHQGPAAGGRRRRRGRWEPWFYLAPAFIVLIALLGYPIFQLVNISLYNYTQKQVSGGAPLTFAGGKNYATLLGDAQFWLVLLNTVVFAAFLVIVTILVGGWLAILATRLRPWVRTVLFSVSLGAWATPAVTGSAVWMFLFDPSLGLVNKVLTGIGLEQFEGYSWTYDRFVAFGFVASEVVWCSFPFVMVTLYAGIKGISEEVIEAARLDGASMLQIAWQIILPMLRPVMMVVVIQSIIWDFKIFSQVYIMTGGGGLAGQNLTLNVYGYQQAFASGNYGLGSALGVIMTLLLMAITLVYLRIIKRNGEEL